VLALASGAVVLAGCTNRVSTDSFDEADERLDQAAWYQLDNMTSGMCADNQGGSLNNGTPIIQWNCSSSNTNQRWQFKSVGNGFFHVVNRTSGLCLNNGGSLTSGTGITQWSCVTSANLEWSLTFRNGWYQLKSHKSGMCLDNTGSDDAGVQLVQKSCSSSSSNQMWALNELTGNQTKVTNGLTSIWENDTPVLQYAYSQNIHDGRGYTNGRAGFCTGTGDAIQVVECYMNRRTAANGNLMAKYWNALVTINNNFLSTGQNQGDTSLLDAVGCWTCDWASSYNNSTTRSDFKSCQDQITYKLYLLPALDAAVKWGMTWALTEAELYDAFVNHGDDGANAIIASTNSALGDSSQVAPVIGFNGITESAWLKKFLEKRRDVLFNDPTWIDAIDRVATYEKQRRRGNVNFSSAVTNDVHAFDCWSHSPAYPDSGYTCRTINPDGTWTTPSSCGHSCN